MLQLLWILFGVFQLMNLKLCAIAATICGIHSLKQTPLSIKPRSVANIGQGVSKQVDNLNSYSILANYNKVLVGSNLK